MSWTRCTNCATIYDRGRFPRCCICGAQPADVFTPPGEEVPMAALAPAIAPEAEREARRDGSLSTGANALGIVLGIIGLAATAMSGDAAPVAVVVMLGILAAVAVAGWSAREKDEPARFFVGKLALRAVITVALLIAGAAALGAVAIAVLFVICVTGGSGGFGS